MNSCKDVSSGVGALVVAGGSTILSYNFYATATDSLIQSTAATCLNVQTVTNNVYQIAKPIAEFRAAPLAEAVSTSLCRTAIRLYRNNLKI